MRLTGDSAFGIPLQRPESFGTRAELNDKEYAEKVARDERAHTQALEEDAKMGIIRPRRPIHNP